MEAPKDPRRKITWSWGDGGRGVGGAGLQAEQQIAALFGPLGLGK